MKALRSDASRFPGLKPRLHHLTAYARVLRKGTSGGGGKGALKSLARCEQLGQSAGNLLEASWAGHSREAWFEGERRQEAFWQRSDEEEEERDWHVVAGGSMEAAVRYILPV